MLGWNHLICASAIGVASATLFGSAASGALGEVVRTGVAQLDGWVPIGEAFPPVLGWMLFLLGTLAPDLDNANSLLRTRVVRPILRLVFRGRGGRRFSIERGPNDFRGHRTWTHTLWVVLALGLAGWFLFRPLLAFALGYAVHLVLDSWSKCGVAWLWPLVIYDGSSESHKWVAGRRGGVYSVGGPTEYVVVALVCVLSVASVALLVYLEGTRDLSALPLASLERVRGVLGL